MMSRQEVFGGTVGVVGVMEVIVDGGGGLLNCTALVVVETRGPLVHVVWGT